MIVHRSHDWAQALPLTLHTLRCMRCGAQANMRLPAPFRGPRCAPQLAKDTAGWHDESAAIRAETEALPRLCQ